MVESTKTQVDILAEGLSFPEGPAFDPNGDLWCVEIQGGNLVHWADGLVERHPTDGSPNGLAFDADGRAWFCDAGQNAIRRFDRQTASWQSIASEIDGHNLRAPNDLAFDAAGNLVFTCPGGSQEEPIGYVCCLSPDGAVTRIAERLCFPNGLAFVEKGESLIIAETYRQRLWRGRWEAQSRRWVDPKPGAQTSGDPGPDGMALAADGLLHTAIFGSGRIEVFDAAGTLAKAYVLPGLRPTNAAFDPSGRLGLVVTEAEKGVLISLPELGPGAELFDGPPTRARAGRQ